jgi:integrase
MASLRTRKHRDGNITHVVLYRHGGRQTSTTFETKKDAANFAKLIDALGPDEALRRLQEDNFEGISLDELAQAFFDWKAASVTPRTLADYRRDYDNWIGPWFGHRPAELIDERDIQEWVDHMTPRLDPKTVGDRHSILHGIYRFGAAKSRQLVTHNPCEETQLPKRVAKPPRGIPLDTYKRLRKAARRIEPDAADLIEYIAATGWRYSEAAALTVADVEDHADADGNQIVTTTMRQVMRQNKPTPGAKSKAGHRRTKVPQPAADILRRRIAGRAPGDLVFTTANAHPWRQQNFLNRTWVRILEAAELNTDAGTRYTPHDLRHAQVALLDRAGATPAQMQRRVGHENIATTLDVYGGMITDIPNDVLDRLSELLAED